MKKRLLVWVWIPLVTNICVGQVTKQILKRSEIFTGFGISVAVYGDYAIVGASNEDGGAAYIFHREDMEWVEEAKLTAEGGWFGNAVSIFEDYVLVGAPYVGVGGAAYIFVREETTWTQQAKLVPSDSLVDRHFGRLVSISDKYAVVGRYIDAFVFKRQGTMWLEDFRFRGDPSGGGTGVSTWGDVVVVGGREDSINEYVDIYRTDGLAWVQEATLVASDGSLGDNFGKAVSIFKDQIIIGAYADDDMGEFSGSAYVYEKTTDSWVEQAKILPSNGAPSGYFGTAVSIAGNHAIVGAPSAPGHAKGTAVILKYDGVDWTEVAILGTPEPYGSALEFGVSVSISRDVAIVGSNPSLTLYDEVAVIYSFPSGDGMHAPLPKENVLPLSLHSHNYPNPFNPATTIHYRVDEDTPVTLEIFNTVGQKVVTIINEFQTAGEKSAIWSGRDETGLLVPSGVYIYKLTAGSSTMVKKMMLLK